MALFTRVSPARPSVVHSLALAVHAAIVLCRCLLGSAALVGYFADPLFFRCGGGVGRRWVGGFSRLGRCVGGAEYCAQKQGADRRK